MLGCMVNTRKKIFLSSSYAELENKNGTSYKSINNYKLRRTVLPPK